MNTLTVTKHRRSRFWAVRDGAGELVCLCVYKRGAVEVARRLTSDVGSDTACLRETPSGGGQEPACPREARPEAGSMDLSENPWTSRVGSP